MDSYILFINVVLIFVLSLIIASTLINKKDDLKTRLSFCFFFLIVIINCSVNLTVIYFGYYQLIFLLFSFSSLNFLFGPMLLQYVCFLLNQKLPNYWSFNYVLSLILFLIGLYYLFIPDELKKLYLQQIIRGKHEIVNYLNLATLLHCFIYFVLSKKYLNKFEYKKNDVAVKMKKKWAVNFVNYMIFCNILIITIYIVLTIFFIENLVLGDLVFMPLIILSVYSYIMIKSLEQNQEIELILSKLLLENQENLQEQRLSISRDLHDNIGSQLSFVISSVDNMKYEINVENTKLNRKLEDISSFTQETILELRDTIWALNTNSLSLSELETRILNFVQNASEAVETINFDFKNNCKTHFQLTSKQGINLFRVVQEAVNNAIKHSKASQINIIIDESENNLLLKIQDNGKGFNYEEKRKKSFGLTNLQKRISELNGTFDLISTDAGTTINSTIPISK